MDDEYFRNNVAPREGHERNPHAVYATQAFLRSMKMPEKRALLRRVLGGLQMGLQRTPSGIEVGPKVTMTIKDGDRLDRVVARTVRGLYRHHLGKVLAPEVATSVYGQRQLDQWNAEGNFRALNWFWNGHIRQFEQFTTRNTVGDGCVLAYWFAVNPADAEESHWALVFYEDVNYMVLTKRIPCSGIRTGL